MTPLLECRNLSKSYGSQQALVDFSLQLQPGRIIGLLGPNGSGKTTLLKLINGLLQPSQGEVFIEGQHPGPKTKSFIAYLPDRLILCDWMRIDQILDFFQSFYQDFDLPRAQEMLKNLGIDSRHKLKSLSKGNVEKVQLIMTMARRARLYLLDEPIGGVDPAARDYIMKTILNNYREEATLLISTHLVQDAEQIFDEVVFLKEGRLFLHQNVDDIRENQGQSVDGLFREVFKC